LDPFEIMAKWPDRYKHLVLAWLREQWNRPSRTDHYLMLIAKRLAQQWSKEAVTLDSQELKFEFKKVPVKKEPTQEDKVARSKAIWLGGLKAARDNMRQQRGH
jgi:hypothetical protein